MLKNLKKIMANLIIIAASLCLLIACAPETPSNQLVQAILSDPKTFNAVLSAESPNVFGLIYEGLITENPCTGEKEPALAESWEVSDDKLRIVFNLRKDLKWSDGQPLTADDVVFTYNELYLNPKIPNNYRDGFRIGKSGEFPQIRKLNAHQIEFVIREPFAPFFDLAESPILPAHILRNTIKETDAQGNPLFLSTWSVDTPPEKIIVNGPYKLKEYLTSQRVIFEKNPYYWKTNRPYIQEIVWAIVESQDTFLLQFRSGGLDSIAVSPEYFSLLKQEENQGNFTIYNGGLAYGTTFISFNLNQGKRNGKPLVDPVKSKWFNNLNFRRAIAHAIDRNRMVDNIYRGLGEPQNSPISAQSPFYDKSLTGYDYNPEKARELLKQAGFKYTSDNKLIDQEGNPVKFTLLTNAGNKGREAMGAQIKEDLGAIGIQVDFTPIAFQVLVDKLTNTLDWDAHILGFTGGNEPHAPNIWYTDGNLHSFNQKPQPGSQPIEGQKFADWEKEIEQLFIKGSQEMNLEKRKAIYAQAQKKIEEYLPYIYLVNPYALGAVRNRFEGIEYCALGGAFWNIDEIKTTDMSL